MNENCKNFLKSIYKKGNFQYTLSKNPEVKDEELSTFKYLEEKGYIICSTLTMGFYSGKLTAHGIDYVENGCVDYTDNHSINGNNNHAR